MSASAEEAAGVLPFEFVVLDSPRSFHTKSRTVRRAWRDQVRTAAKRRWPWYLRPLNGPLQIVVVYFHTGPDTRLDNDNLIKPILDALIGIVYADDRQLTDLTIRKTSLDALVNARGISMVVAEGFNYAADFVYIKIDMPPDHRELL